MKMRMEKHRTNSITWDECFMRIAFVISERSKDPSTQVGAVVVSAQNIILGAGYNGWPRGIEADELPWNREGEFHETKYAYVCHAEENAIYNSNTSVSGGKIYCTLFPCNECAKTLIQNGIKEIIFESDKYNDTPSIIASRKLFDLAGVKYRQYIRNK
jgi:dCMP deaminase